MYRIGLGQDSHSFDKKNKKELVFGGVEFTDKTGFAGNSDGDVILHSICNALSSAIGGDSLGTWSDKMFLKKGIKSSVKYLEDIFSRVKEKKYSVENISISCEMKKPYLEISKIKQIKKKIAELLEISSDCVGLTITSGENLTAFGKGQGAQVLTIVLIKKNVYRKS